MGRGEGFKNAAQIIAEHYADQAAAQRKRDKKARKNKRRKEHRRHLPARKAPGEAVIFRPDPSNPVAFKPNAESRAFLLSYEWRKVRMLALKKYGAKCACCGATPATGATINIDHIKPRRLYPELALNLDNLQVLCHECNHGKGNWDMTDWREAKAKV